MKPALVILNPRRIKEFEASLKRLDIDTIRLRGYTEPEIANGIWTRMVDGARHRHYTHLSIISDDCIIPPHTLENVLDHAKSHPDRITTGWCNLDLELHGVNLCDQPIKDDFPVVESYSFPSWHDVMLGPEVRRTYFAGFSCTTATIQMWSRYSYRTYGAGFAADYAFSRQLQLANVRIDALRDAYCFHIKHRVNKIDKTPGRELLIGEVKPAIVWPDGTEEWT